MRPMATIPPTPGPVTGRPTGFCDVGLDVTETVVLGVGEVLGLVDVDGDVEVLGLVEVLGDVLVDGLLDVLGL